uniref:Putative secreted protein n=1 Tax=Anopheles marajoara TaxID=58244 RepID=A0A2M4CAG4_9DIPT
MAPITEVRASSLLLLAVAFTTNTFRCRSYTFHGPFLDALYRDRSFVDDFLGFLYRRWLWCWWWRWWRWISGRNNRQHPVRREARVDVLRIVVIR